MAERSPFHPRVLLAGLLTAGLWTLVSPGLGIVVGFVARLLGAHWPYVLGIGFGVALIALPFIAKRRQLRAEGRKAIRALAESKFWEEPEPVRPLRQPRDETDGALTRVVEAFAAAQDSDAHTRPPAGQISEASASNAAALARAKLLLGTELRDIRVKIERVKSQQPMVYPTGFQLPGHRWAESQGLLANEPHLYARVERAYTAAHHVNESLRMREARQPAEDAPLIVALPSEDGLDRAHGLAGEALDALAEPHNEPVLAPAGQVPKPANQEDVQAWIKLGRLAERVNPTVNHGIRFFTIGADDRHIEAGGPSMR